MTGRLEGRIALISGASRGIGAAIAKRYAAEGAHPVLIARNAAALEEVDDEIQAANPDSPPATLLPLDLTDYATLDGLPAAIQERFGRLDIVVFNHSILGSLTPIPQIDPKEWDQVLAVNLTATWRLLRVCDPLLRLSDSGRAIFVSSGAAQGIRPYWATYAVSKAALESMARSYAGEVQETTIRANIVNPGKIRTQMRAAAYPGEDPMALKAPEEITDIFVDLAEATCTVNGERFEAQ